MLNSRFSAVLSKIGRVFLKHRCTVVEYITVLDDLDQPVLDDEGQPTYTEQGTLDVPCLLVWQDVNTTDDRGTVIESTPKIYFDSTFDVVTIKPSLLIQSLQDEKGNLLLSGAIIKTVNPTAEGGSTTLILCELEGAQVSNN